MTESFSLSIKTVKAMDVDLLALIEELDLELYERYPRQLVHGLDLNDEHKIKDVVFKVAYYEDKPAGCGALRRINATIGELKRMYVRPAFRKKGIARMILNKLERKAMELGYERIWLETGTKQPDAIALYTRYGYTSIPKYGEYKQNPESLCYEKKIR